MVKKLKTEYVAAALASLGHEACLSVYRLLVRAGQDGLTVGEVSEQLGLPASTLVGQAGKARSRSFQQTRF